jgi:C-terminal processing protease CtpA/Prc
MTGLVSLGLLLIAQPPPTPDVPNVDRGAANSFAHVVHRLAEEVARKYGRFVPGKDVVEGVGVKELIEAAVRGMYEEAGLPVPPAVVAAARRANNPGDQLTLLADARVALGNAPELAGTRMLFAAVNGFRHATDPNCQLASPRVNSFASVDMDYGVGIELEGATAARWALFQTDHAFATGRFPPVGGVQPLPTRDTLRCPAAVPWRVARVVPGSPAQRAGLRPGDVLTHLNGVAVTPENAAKLFAEMAYPAAPFDPNTGRTAPVKRAFLVRRGADPKPFPVELSSDPYVPECVHGVLRTADDKWDCMLDREYRIGYVRVGPVEDGADLKLTELMESLAAQGARGVILDLRWCPGGYVTPGTKIAGMFLPAHALIARMRYRNPGEVLTPPDVPNPYFEGGPFRTVPLVVLVGSETTGGGELIAAALQDAGRAAVMGQRTVGRATIQNVIDSGVAGLQFKVTTGTSLRPNGKPRQKLPTSRPTDDWGVRPDPGLEVPVTPDLSAELRAAAEAHALRPAGSNEALPFDDPARDPFRAAALSYFRKKLGRPDEKK